MLAQLFLGKFQAEIQPEAGKRYEKFQSNEVWQLNGVEQPSLYMVSASSEEAQEGPYRALQLLERRL